MVGADRGDEGATLTSQIALKGAAMEATVTEAGTILEELYTTVARAFVLDANNEWIPVATGAVVGEKSEDKNILTVSLNEETNPDVVLFSTTFHQSNQERVIRQQGCHRFYLLTQHFLIYFCSHCGHLDYGRSI